MFLYECFNCFNFLNLMLSIFILDAVRVVSEMWKNFDVDSKNKMNEIYIKELEQYREGVIAYKESLTEDQKNELFRVKYEEVELKAKRKLKRVCIVTYQFL